MGTIGTLLVLLGAVVPGRAAGARADPVVFAVVVGHNDGWGLLPQLRYADDDALRFYRLALQLAPRQNVALLTELDVDTWRRLQLSGTPPPPFLPPTKPKLLKVIDLFKRQIAATRRKDPRRPVHLLLFFSGHGERGYFFLKRAVDGDQRGAAARRGAAFTGDDLRRAFAGSLATLNGLFIDACKSQSLFVDKGGGGDEELGPDFSGLIRKVEQAARRTPIGVLTSTLSDRPAGEADDIRGGYFSHVLTSGLSGAADANSDGLVRYDELAAFVAFHTRRISGQQPWFRPPAGKLKTTLVRLDGRGNLLELPPGLGGHFAVFDERSGALRLEVHKTAAQWTRLLLAPGRYRVVRVLSPRKGLAAIAAVSGAKPVRLMRDAFVTAVALGQTAVAKGEGLGAPVGPSGEAGAERSPFEGALESFRPAQSGFDQPFTPRVVSTLAVAYSSGLTARSPERRPVARQRPLVRRRGRPHRLSAGYGYFGPPAEVGSFGHGFTAAYAHQIRSWLQLGGRASFAISEHRSARTAGHAGLPFRMHRLMLQVEALYVHRPWRWLELAVGAQLGWQMTLLTQDAASQCGEFFDQQCTVTTLTGDAAGLRAGAIGSVRVPVGAGVLLSLDGGFGLETVRQQGSGGERAMEPFWRPQLFGQVAYAF